MYRLVEASGCEHAGQTSFGTSDLYNDLPFLKQYQSGDAMV